MIPSSPRAKLGRDLAVFGLLSITLALPSSSTAQPPWLDSNRWSGQTAIVPAQGYTQGSPITLTWGFMALGTAINNTGSGIPNAANNLQTRLNTIYPGGQAQWQPVFQSMFDRWSSLSGVTYQFEANDDSQPINGSSGDAKGLLGTRPDLRIGGKPLDGNFGILAYNYFPNLGDMVIDTNDSFFTDTSNSSLRLRQTTAHEHGHGMGMDHVDSTNAKILMQPVIDLTYDGPQHHDILVAHRAYGDFFEKSNAGLGNDTAARATPLGAVTTSTPKSIGNSARTLAVSATATDFVSIDDNTDTDFYSFSIAGAARLNALLESLGFTYNATAQGAGGNVAFNSQTRSDLALALFDTDGTTLLASSDVTGLGGNESLSVVLANAGTYFIRITGADNPDALALDAQFYGLTLSLTAVPEPTTWALIVGGVVSSSVGYRRWRRRRLQQLEQMIEPDLV